MKPDKSILQPIAEYLKQGMIHELTAQGKNVSGELINSIEVIVKQVTDGFEISGNSVYYGIYVDQGRKKGAKGVPISALLTWIRAKNIQAKGIKEQSLAFAIQRSIKNKGIKPSLFIQKALDKFDKNISSEIEYILYNSAIKIVENIILQSLTI